MKKFLAVLLVLISVISLFSGCGNEKPTNTPTICPQFIPPHSENTAEELISFINTVDENTFENGAFKDIISRVRTKGYILYPCLDGSPIILSLTGEFPPVSLSPNQVSSSSPAGISYYFIENQCKYLIGVLYADESHLQAVDTNAYTSFYHADEKFQQKLYIDGAERNVSFFVTSGTSAHFVLDDLLITVNSNILFEDSDPFPCDADFLSRLSFKKIPLK